MNATASETTPDGSSPSKSRAPWATYGLTVALVVAVVARFVAGSPLWLDEALSFNIAELPIGDLLDALRRDGHPPAYYVLLHGWMEVFGTGDVAVRALSGVMSVATLPLAYAAGGRRGGGTVGLAVLGLAAFTPFALRYATEARMYAMVTLVVFVGWLLADDLRERPSRVRWVALAATTGIALLTHYWVMFLGAGSVLVLAYAWWRHGRRSEALRIGSALAVGCVAFLPWLPSFLEQMAHTGTPWATAGRPTDDLATLMFGLGGGDHGEAVVFGAVVMGLFVVGAFVERIGGISTIVSTIQTEVSVDIALATATMVLGLGVGLATNAAFVARYAAVILPMLLVVAGRGIAVLPGRYLRAGVVLVLGVTAAPGLILNVVEDRTQGEENSTAIVAIAKPGDVVAFCPDQLGPSTERGLPDDVIAVGLPALDPAAFVDWIDYEERNTSADPSAVAASLLELSDGQRIFLVTMVGYRTYEGFCSAVRSELTAARGPASVSNEPSDVFETSELLVFDALGDS